MRTSFDDLHVCKSDGVILRGSDLIKIVIGGIGGQMRSFARELNDNGCQVSMGAELINIDQFVESYEI